MFSVVTARAPAFVVLAFALVTAGSLAWNPRAFNKLVQEPPAVRGDAIYWDLEHYLHIATTGYDNDKVVAFYPLWPTLVRALNAWGTETAALRLLYALSTLLFVAALFRLHRFFRRRWGDDIAALVLLAFAVSPVSIFHVIGYSESLFTLLSVLLLERLALADEPRTRDDILLAGLAFLASLTRPVLLQLAFAMVGAVLILRAARAATQAARLQRSALLVVTGAIAGYGVYGTFCAVKLGNFFAPFAAQRYWDREFGLHLHLLFAPTSEFLWDILALDVPPLLFIGVFLAGLRRPRWVSASVDLLRTDALFLVCALFALAHDGIAFFTQKELGSLGRFVFGVPWFFVCMGDAATVLPPKVARVGLWTFAVLGAAGLVQCWDRFGDNQWFG